MKIGILTYHAVSNFGANLQVYSTVGYLKNKGFEPRVINWVPDDMIKKSDIKIPLVQAEVHLEFVRTNLPCTELCRTDEDIVSVIEEENIKGIIIGSDAIFRHQTFLSRISLSRKGIFLAKILSADKRYPNPFWGSFITKLKYPIPVVVISASSQNTKYKYITGDLKRRMNNSLHRFNLLTVRDSWTRYMVNYLSGRTILPTITPDPVFAYNQNIRDQIPRNEIYNKFGLPEKYILISIRSQNIVSKEWLNSLKVLAEEKNLHCVALTMPDGITFEHTFDYSIEPPLDPKYWYGLIRFSSGYIGENMHPIVVALHNAVPFFSFDSYGIVDLKFFVNEKSSKIYDILSLAGLLNNRITVLGRGFKPPTPQKVINQITNFDIAKCNKFISIQLDKYNKMMTDILRLFN